MDKTIFSGININTIVHMSSSKDLNDSDKKDRFNKKKEDGKTDKQRPKNMSHWIVAGTRK